MAYGVFFTVLLLCQTPVSAQTQPAAPAAAATAVPAPVIAVVDIEQILQETAAAKSVRSQATKYEQSFQGEFAKEEATLKSTQQDLENQRKTMAQDVFAEKARAFEESFGAFQRKNAMRHRAFDVSMNAAMGKVQQAMLNATQHVATARGVTVVLPRSQVMLFDEKMNITKEIIAEMDKVVSYVDFPAPKLEGAPTASGGGAKKKTQ
jgi:Skp family chaperone for outer membrane proteins